MPKRRTVSSLQSLCLENVALHMESIWVKDDTGNSLHQDHVPCTEGPFSQLAGSLVLELLQLIVDSYCLTSAMLYSLLVPQLTELNLGRCPELISRNIARIISVRCKNLSTLDLPGCRQISAKTLADLVKGLPCLTKLDLSDTHCDTQVLSAVGSCCRRLRDLDISGCEWLFPRSLLNLAYDYIARSFCCPDLRRLTAHGLGSNTLMQQLSWALAFVLLALPRLKSVFHRMLPEAVCLIYHQQFDNVRIPRMFPSLEELSQNRMSTHVNEESPRLTLPLAEMYLINESTLPAVCSLCPHLATLTVVLNGSSSLDQTFLSCRHLTHLTIRCRGNRDLRELLPVMTSLGAQLQSLSFSGFSFEDKLSFHTLLSHCLNLQTFGASLLPPERHTSRRNPDVEALGWDFGLTAYKFPQLCDLLLIGSDLDDPLLSQHATVLRASLVSLLKHSPWLETVELVGLPFSLDGVFEEVLEPPGSALVHLCKLLLVQNEVSIQTIHRLLSSDNQLSFLVIDGCSNIQQMDYDELLGRVSREGFELNIMWK